MPLEIIIACSVFAAAIAGVGTYVILTRVAEAYVSRQAPVRLQTPSPFALADETRTDLLALPEAQTVDREPPLDLRLAWHVARRAQRRVQRRHQAT